MRSVIASLTVLSVLGLLWCWAGLVYGNPYVITDLGTLGGDSSQAYGINNAGQVVGASQVKIGSLQYERPFLYSNGTMTDLGYLGSQLSNGAANGISPDGNVVGVSNGKAFLYAGGTLQDISGQVGAVSSAQGMNAAGQIVGYSTDSLGYDHAFLYNTGDHSLSDLGISSRDYPYSYAYGINSSGQVVGQLGDNGAYQRAFLYNNGTVAQLKCLGPYNAGGTPMYGDAAFAINDAGQAAGWSLAAGSGCWEPFLHDGTTATGLGNLFGYDSAVYSVNAGGEAVGYTNTEFGDHAMIYRNGKLADLGSLIAGSSNWYLKHANGINDSGWIVGDGFTGGKQHAFLLKPALAGDANLDGTADVADLAKVLTNYNRSGVLLWADGDFSGDYHVDVADLASLLTNYNRSLGSAAGATATAVPEPGALAMLAAGLAGLAVWSGRKRG